MKAVRSGDVGGGPIHTPGQVVGRIAAAMLCPYAMCWGAVALGMTSLVAGGMGFEDAEHLSGIVAVLAYVAVFMWGFVVRRWVVWAVAVTGAGGVMAALAQCLQSYLLA